MIHYVEQTDSTMNEARRLVGAAHSKTVPSGTVVVAGVQSSGRGRVAGRRWEASPGDGLLFTIIFTKDDLSRRMSGRPFTLLPLLCGLGTAEGVSAYLADCAAGAGADADIRIKWPNDVLAGGRKLCGILCEAAGDYIYAGIGINLNQESFSDSLRRPACSIRMLTGRSVPNEGPFPGSELLHTVLRRIMDSLENAEWQSALEHSLYRIGENVRILPGLPGDAPAAAAGQAVTAEELSGRLCGVSGSGALLIETNDGVVPVISGELRV